MVMAAQQDEGLLRRSWVTERGEPLLVARDPMLAMLRFGELARQWGIPQDEVISSRTVSVALPRWPETWPEGRRRWDGLRPEALWNPLCWLPPRLVKRADLLADSGEIIPEGDDEWATRVALELTVSGVYDEARGTWLDVLSTVGIDVEDRDDLARLQAWLDGTPDPALDSIDLDVYVADGQDLSWSVPAAAGLVPDLMAYSWAFGANSMIEVLSSLPGELKDGMPLETAVSVAGTVAYTGAAWLFEVPGSDVSGVLRRIVGGFETAGLTAESFLSGPVEEMIEALTEVREAFWPDIEALVTEAGGLENLLPHLYKGDS